MPKKKKTDKRLKKLLEKDKLDMVAASLDDLRHIALHNQNMLAAIMHDLQVVADRITPQQRFDIFARMTLISLDSIQMQAVGLSTVKFDAFDPPLHHIPADVQMRFVPPGNDMEEYDHTQKDAGI